MVEKYLTFERRQKTGFVDREKQGNSEMRKNDDARIIQKKQSYAMFKDEETGENLIVFQDLKNTIQNKREVIYKAQTRVWQICT